MTYSKKGDPSEYKAVQKIFCNKVPFFTTKIGKMSHTFGASGTLNIELAVLKLLHQEFINVPFLEIKKAPKRITNILVNAVGFGGNAVSILLSSLN